MVEARPFVPRLRPAERRGGVTVGWLVNIIPVPYPGLEDACGLYLEGRVEYRLLSSNQTGINSFKQIMPHSVEAGFLNIRGRYDMNRRIGLHHGLIRIFPKGFWIPGFSILVEADSEHPFIRADIIVNTAVAGDNHGIGIKDMAYCFVKYLRLAGQPFWIAGGRYVLNGNVLAQKQVEIETLGRKTYYSGCVFPVIQPTQMGVITGLPQHGKDKPVFAFDSGHLTHKPGVVSYSTSRLIKSFLLKLGDVHCDSPQRKKQGGAFDRNAPPGVDAMLVIASCKAVPA